ncbi:MAG: hypothetical protein F6K50_43530 [Moorea sp. SIO3I7]|nr:hypothetical protein [Moorena sp. SIO3I7]
MTRFARGDLKGAKAEFDKIRRWGNHADVAGVRLLLPKNQELTREKPKSFRVYWRTLGILILISAGTVGGVRLVPLTSPPPDPFFIKVITIPGCLTSPVRGLDQQLINQLNVVRPKSLVSFEDLNVQIGTATWPYLQPAAKQALQQAIDERGKTLFVASAYRTIAQQLVLWNHYRNQRCSIRGAARPPESNHQSGLALDIPDYQDWRPFLEKHGWQWDGPKDRPHFDYVGANTIDIRADSVLAFQQLWNLNNPTDRIKENGMFDAETELRLNNSPVDGFPKEGSWWFTLFKGLMSLISGRS